MSKTLGFWTYDTQHKIVMQIIMDRNAQCWFFQIYSGATLHPVKEDLRRGTSPTETEEVHLIKLPKKGDLS